MSVDHPSGYIVQLRRSPVTEVPSDPALFAHALEVMVDFWLLKVRAAPLSKHKNEKVGTINRYGHIHKGHYAPWLVKTISTMYKKLGIFDHGSRVNQTSTCLYDTESNLSNETFGIVSFARNLAEDLHIDIEDRDNQYISQVGASLSVRMSTYFVLQSTSTNNPKGQMYKCLAEKTRNQIMDRCHDAQLHANWKEMAKSWNTDHTNGVTTFYKTPEHLKAYCGVWDERRVANDSISASADICEVMREHLQSPGRARASIPAQIPSSAEVPMTIAEPSRPSYSPSGQTTGSNSRTPRNIIPNMRDPGSSSRQTPFNLADLPKKSTRICSICKDPSCKGFSLKSRCKLYRQQL
ncbi:hypothetical protein DFQ30_003936 [Apophysomyces sp. BC1015]|nr:hypothetical protein DFQ30_003936 [Apophysomyces sp. BC1015]